MEDETDDIDPNSSDDRQPLESIYEDGGADKKNQEPDTSEELSWLVVFFLKNKNFCN